MLTDSTGLQRRRHIGRPGEVAELEAEIAISLFSRQCLGRRRIGDRASLRRETQAWSRCLNHPSPHPMAIYMQKGLKDI
jgi:hypothetical protein